MIGLISKRSRQVSGASILSIALVQAAFAQYSPSNFNIESIELYSHPKGIDIPLHIHDIVTLELHWTLYNATFDDYIMVRLDPALQIAHPQGLSLVGESTYDNRYWYCELQLSECGNFQLKGGILYCVLNKLEQGILNKCGILRGTILLMTTLNAKLIGDDINRKFEFLNVNIHQQRAFSSDVEIARVQNYEQVSVPETDLQRTCSWVRPSDGDDALYFTCTIILPVIYQWSRLLVTDNIVRGEAIRINASFIEKDVNDFDKESLVSSDRYNELYNPRGYMLHTKIPSRGEESSDMSRFRYRLEILYRSNHSADDVNGFVGKAVMKNNRYNFQVDDMCYLPPYSTWERIFPYNSSEPELKISWSDLLS